VQIKPAADKVTSISFARRPDRLLVSAVDRFGNESGALEAGK
jgi:hypothetical protein